jgi:hypothetical protein
MYRKDLELEKKWHLALNKIRELIGKKPKDLNAVLFLVGVQELGKGARHFSKEEKQDLMHIAVCKALSYSGFYQLKGLDNDGWPHWELVKPLPRFDLLEQEKLLKIHLLEYFEKELKIELNVSLNEET